VENLWKMMELIGKIYRKRMNTVEIIWRITQNGGQMMEIAFMWNI